MHPISALLALSLLSAAVSAAPQTVVSGGGMALQAAANASSAGEVLVVRAGQYGPLTVRRGISIQCDPGVVIASSPTRLEPALVVVGLPAQQAFVLTGAELLGNLVAPSILIRDTEAMLVLEECRTPDNCIVSNVGRLAWRECELDSVDCTNSRASFVDTRVLGELVATGSHITVSGGEVRGFDGVSVFPGSPAIRLVDSTLSLTGDSSTRVAPGARANSSTILVDANSAALIDPQVVVEAPSGIPPIAGVSRVERRAIPYVSSSDLVIGQAFSVRTGLSPGASVSLFVAPAAPSPVPTPWGEWWLAPDVLELASGASQVPGELSVTVTVPAAVLPGQVFCIQAIGLSTGGELALSPPLCIGVRP